VYLLHKSMSGTGEQDLPRRHAPGVGADGGGEYELRMAILVKPNGRFGRVYMALIAPFRYLIVYPRSPQWSEPAGPRASAHRNVDPRP